MFYDNMNSGTQLDDSIYAVVKKDVEQSPSGKALEKAMICCKCVS